LCPLLIEVELCAKVHVQLVRERLHLQQLRGLRVLVEQACGCADQIEVALDDLFDAGPAHLDGNLQPVRELRTVDLRNRRCGERLRIDLREEVAVELFVQHLLDLRERHRRYLVDEPRQLLDVDIGKQVRPRREELAELDVRRAELFERIAELASAFDRSRTLAGHSDLAQDAEEPATARDARNVQRALETLGPRTHRACCYLISSRRTAFCSSVAETEPSNLSLMRPSAPTRNTHGSDSRCHCRIQRL
jgi:hypothetical protein